MQTTNMATFLLLNIALVIMQILTFQENVMGQTLTSPEGNVSFISYYNSNATETSSEDEIPKIPLCSNIKETKYHYVMLRQDNAFIPSLNRTIKPSSFGTIDGKLCLIEETVNVKQRLDCTKSIYEPDEFQILPNGSVLLYDEILEEGTYEFIGSSLETCIIQDEDYSNEADHKGPGNPVEYRILVYIGQIGAILSVMALTLHLLVFAVVKSLHNLPGYNLASLSVAFLIAYCFVLIGQIPQVLGTACVVSAVFVQYFFLVAFMWMNVISFDVWRALKSATTKFTTTSSQLRARKFLFYYLYAWIIPLTITIPAVVIDSRKDLPDTYKPYFGRKNICSFTNPLAKLVFFIAPAFSLVIINCIFFILCTFTIVKNTMKNPSDQQKIARRNFVLYARLGIIMGVTWVFGVIAVFVDHIALWFLFDFLNSFQGVFVFLLFPCSRKVWYQFRKRFTGDNSKSTNIWTSSSSKCEDH